MGSMIGAFSVGEYSTTQQDKLGREWSDEAGRKYVYVKFTNAVTYLQGHTLTWDDADAFEVTNDLSEGTARAAGVVPYDANNTAVPTQNSYGYMQVGGIHARVLKTAADDTWLEGTYVRTHQSTDGLAEEAASVAAPTAAERPYLLGMTVGISDDTNDWVPVRLGPVS